MSKAELTVVFPTYKRPEDVKLTLELLSRNLTIPYEVIILDNSPDPFQFNLRSNEKYFFSGSNLGTAARNIGIEKAEAPYLLMLDDDSHPLEGAVEQAIELLEKSPEEIAGVTGLILRQDGGRENPPLLPTAFHGCGFLCRTNELKKIGAFYPDDFCFYGEEYLSAMLLYRNNRRFVFSKDFKVCHRMSMNGRNVGKILYHLTVNNRRTWAPLVPEKYLSKVMLDTERRYELISIKEAVHEQFLKAVSEDIEIKDYQPKLTEKQFEDFSLLSAFRKLAESGKLDVSRPVFLCSCGKFPALWADCLKEAGIREIFLSDFNTGLIGRKYSGYTVMSPESASEFYKKGCQFILGHSSRTDADSWKIFLEKHEINTFSDILI
jgi:GT2 family glycosyltransferase